MYLLEHREHVSDSVLLPEHFGNPWDPGNRPQVRLRYWVDSNASSQFMLQSDHSDQEVHCPGTEMQIIFNKNWIVLDQNIPKQPTGEHNAVSTSNPIHSVIVGLLLMHDRCRVVLDPSELPHVTEQLDHSPHGPQEPGLVTVVLY